MRKPVIAANWKMYKTAEEARAFFAAFLPKVKGHTRDAIVVCPPALAVYAAVDAAYGSNVHIGAQNCYWKEEGAFTGEISPAMIVASGATHVIIGHSERRQYFGETDETVNKKLKAALAHKLTPIFCIGETDAERAANLTAAVLERQVMGGLEGISAEKFARLVIAYEPVWAIGTGKTATPAMANDAHALVRERVEVLYGREHSDAVRILYGGSVKPENASALMAEPEIDGALVGGASLDADSFARIVQYTGA
jgi:triosephosphate isomerase